MTLNSSRSWPRTGSAARHGTAGHPPGDAAFRALAIDLAPPRVNGTLSTAARRLNYDINGFRTLIMNTAPRPPAATADWSGELSSGSMPAGASRETWAAHQQASGPLTALLPARRHRYAMRPSRGPSSASQPRGSGDLSRCSRPDFRIGLTVTLLSLFLGFPVAYLMATRPPATANLLTILVLLPFWTSLLVRTSAWVVFLQERGRRQPPPWSGSASSIAPVQLIYNRIGVTWR